jgi:hypothetical protein
VEAWTLAAEASGGLGTFTPVAQLVATAVITGLFIWTVTRYVPGLQDEARKEMAAAREEFVIELRAERASREATTEKFMKMITDNREMSHTQRMEDRKTYLESTQAMLREFLAAIKEVKKNGHP